MGYNKKGAKCAALYCNIHPHGGKEFCGNHDNSRYAASQRARKVKRQEELRLRKDEVKKIPRKVYRTVLASQAIAILTGEKPPNSCQIEDCVRMAMGKDSGICNMHYYRQNSIDLEWKEKRYELRQALLGRYKSIVYEHYGDKCNCCSEAETMFLQIDHINNDGYKERADDAVDRYRQIIKKGFPNTLQLLCANCNWGKAQNGGVCPHKANMSG